VIPMHDRPGAESPYIALDLVLSPTKLMQCSRCQCTTIQMEPIADTKVGCQT
jgi:hypothetical protein